MQKLSQSLSALILLWLCGGPALADWPLEIIPLQHQTVEQMLPLLRPFVTEGGTVTGMNGQLVLRTSPDNLAELRRIIERFDRAPQQLLISVRQGGARHHRNRRLGVEGRHTSDRGTLTIGRGGDGIHLYLEGRDKHLSTEAVRQLRVSEGQPAFIQSGQQLPVVTTSPGPWGRPWPQRQYIDATSGFSVTPWVQGDRVTLEIHPFERRLGDARGSLEVQTLTTRITGRLGEWIPLGGSHLEESGEKSGLIHHATGNRRELQPVEVKVERLAP